MPTRQIQTRSVVTAAIRPLLVFTSVATLFLSIANPQTDPGVRSGPAGAGDSLSGLTAGQKAFFNQGLTAFSDVDPVGEGLGPRFNADSCASCHAFPAIGGTGPPP